MSQPQPTQPPDGAGPADLTAVALVAAYQQQTQALRAQLEDFIRQLWQSFGTYRQPQMRDFIGQAVPMVNGAQQHMSSITSAYLSEHRQLQLPGGSLRTVSPDRVTGAAVRNGVAPTEVYGRPFHLVWQQLAQAQAERDAHYEWTTAKDAESQPALPPEDYVQKAIQSGEDRAVNLAATDVQLAKTHTAQQIISRDPKATGSQRILEGAYSCGLCIVASTRPYHKAKLLPIHPGCDCSQEPLYGELPDDIRPTARVNGELVEIGDLPQVHQAVKDRFGKSSAGAKFIPGAKGLQYRDVLIEHHDGEIGPVLAVRGQKFSGPNEGGARRG